MENRTMILEKEKHAKFKVKKLKGFYTHLTIFIVVNTLLITIKLVGTTYYGDYFMGPFWHFSTIAPALFWGIGLAVHGFNVFGFGKNWEERQIQKYLEK